MRRAIRVYLCACGLLNSSSLSCVRFVTWEALQAAVQAWSLQNRKILNDVFHWIAFRFVSFRSQSELSFIMVSFIRALPCMMIIESISWTRTEAANQIDRAFHHTGIVLAWREWISSLATLAFDCVGASKCDFTCFFFWNSRQDWWACNKIVYAQVKMLFIIYSIALSSTFFIFIYMSI